MFDDLVVSDLGKIRYPDLTAEIADLLLRLAGSNWVVCTGIYGEALTISVRTRAKQGAGSVLRDMVGDEGVWGGHGTLAGGQIPLHGREARLVVLQSNDRLIAILASTLTGLRADGCLAESRDQLVNTH